MAAKVTQLHQELIKPFPAAHVAWRIQHTTQDKTRGLAVPYVQSRAIQSRLDEVVGPFNWKSEYKPWHNTGSAASQLCGISIYSEERGEWIQKWDGAENTDIEPIKGGISDSFKRAAVLWGIGRYLYDLDAQWVEVEQRGKSYVIPAGALRELGGKYEKAMGIKPGKVSSLPASASEPPPYEYTVRKVETRQFSSGDGLVLYLRHVDGKDVEAFVQNPDQNLTEGICLRDVTLTPFQSGDYRSYVMSEYKVA